MERELPPRRDPGADYWNDQRISILEWLTGRSGRLGELYVSAIEHAFETPPRQARILMLAHAVREIGNRLPEEISDSYEQRSDTTGVLENFVKGFEKIIPPPEQTEEDPSQPEETSRQGPRSSGRTTIISGDFFDLLKEVATKHRESIGRQRRNAIAMFQAVFPDASERELLPQVDLWLKVLRSGPNFAHVGDGDPKWETVLAWFEKFEDCLIPLSAKFFDIFEQVDDLLGKANRKRTQ